MRSWWRRFQFVMRRSRHEAELLEEMRQHRDLSGAGAFGSDALAMNQARDVWIAPWWQDLTQDIAFSLRMLAKDRRFTVAAVLALALGMGVNLSVFTAVDAAIMRDVPFDDPSRLVRLATTDARGNESQNLSWPDFLDLRERVRAFEGLAGESGGSLNISEPGLLAERLRGAYVSANLFRLLRVAPALGRDFRVGDDQPGAPDVVIISHQVWRDRYGSDPGVVGRTVKVNDRAATLIGVMPPGFRYPMVTQAWQPLVHSPAFAGTAARRDVRAFGAIARVIGSGSAAAANAELTAVSATLADEHPQTNARTRITAGPMKAAITRGISPLLIAMMGAVAVVLLIACANLAALLLSRSAQRAREVAIRISLGATRWRIVRQLLCEVALLALGAVVVGLGISRYGADEISIAFSPIGVGTSLRDARPYWLDLSLDGWIALFAALLGAVATIACGLIPALQISRTDPHDTLKQGGRLGVGARASRWTAGLMVAQIALSLMLLTGTGLIWRQFITLYHTDPGVDTQGVVAASLALPVSKYQTDQARQQFFTLLRERAAAAAAIESATLASTLPLVGFGGAPRALSVEGRTPSEMQRGISVVAVGDAYFATLGLPIVAGRPLNEADARPQQEGIVISERVAALYFPDGDALGKRVQIQGATPVAPASAWLTVVGIAKGLPVVRVGPPPADPTAVAYVPLRSEASVRTVTLVVRAAAPADATVAALRETMAALDPDLPLYDVQTLDDAYATTWLPVKTLGTWASTLAVIAIVVASVGLFALTAHAVVQRTPEIGVRLALGARPSAVVWTMMRRALLQVAIGVPLGLASMVAAAPLLRAFLGPTNAYDPITLAVVTSLLVVVATIATLLPARRAAKVDPVVALRTE